MLSQGNFSFLSPPVQFTPLHFLSVFDKITGQYPEKYTKDWGPVKQFQPLHVHIYQRAGGLICQHQFASLPPALAEEVIFSVASVCVCVSVCALQAEPLDLRT